MGGNVNNWEGVPQQQNIQPLPDHLKMQEVLRRQGLPPQVDNQAEMLGLTGGQGSVNQDERPKWKALKTGALVGGAAGIATGVEETSSDIEKVSRQVVRSPENIKAMRESISAPFKQKIDSETSYMHDLARNPVQTHDAEAYKRSMNATREIIKDIEKMETLENKLWNDANRVSMGDDWKGSQDIYIERDRMTSRVKEAKEALRRSKLKNHMLAPNSMGDIAGEVSMIRSQSKIKALQKAEKKALQIMEKPIFEMQEKLVKKYGFDSVLGIAGSISGGLAGGLAGGIIDIISELFDAPETGRDSDYVRDNPEGMKPQSKTMADLRQMNERAPTQHGRDY